MLDGGPVLGKGWLPVNFLLFLLQDQRNTVESTHGDCWVELGATFLKLS